MAENEGGKALEMVVTCLLGTIFNSLLMAWLFRVEGEEACGQIWGIIGLYLTVYLFAIEVIAAMIGCGSGGVRIPMVVLLVVIDYLDLTNVEPACNGGVLKVTMLVLVALSFVLFTIACCTQQSR